MIDAERRVTTTTKTPVTPLQWGRVVIDAERGHRRGLHGAPDASMGPRRDRRGEAGVDVEKTLNALTLQWGRVVIDAERYSVDPIDGERTMLQWGRVVIDAESGPPASTGSVRGSFNGAAS